MRHFRLGIGVAACVGVTCLVAGAAGAYVTAANYKVTDYATGFATQSHGQTNSAGPIGIAFDLSGNLYVGDVIDGAMYKFPPGGGTASVATKFGDYAAGLSGIAFSVDDRLYAANQTKGVIVEVSMTNKQVIRTVSTAVKCPTSLAFDPISGDLFASQELCAGPVVRIKNPASNSPTVVDYTSGTKDVDGLSFAPDGSLFLVDGDNDQIQVKQFAGTNSANPGALLATVANVPYGDGIAFSKPVGGAPPHYLFVNRRDGKMTRLDMTTSPPAQLDIVAGGTRGDFVTVGDDNCVYPTQSETVTKITHDDGTCDWFPTHVRTPVAAAPATPTTTSAPAGPTPTAAPSPAPAPSGAASTGSTARLPATGGSPWWPLVGAGVLASGLAVRRLRRLHPPG